MKGNKILICAAICIAGSCSIPAAEATIASSTEETVFDFFQLSWDEILEKTEMKESDFSKMDDTEIRISQEPIEIRDNLEAKIQFCYTDAYGLLLDHVTYIFESVDSKQAEEIYNWVCDIEADLMDLWGEPDMSENGILQQMISFNGTAEDIWIREQRDHRFTSSSLSVSSITQDEYDTILVTVRQWDGGEVINQFTDDELETPLEGIKWGMQKEDVFACLTMESAEGRSQNPDELKESYLIEDQTILGQAADIELIFDTQNDTALTGMEISFKEFDAENLVGEMETLYGPGEQESEDTIVWKGITVASLSEELQEQFWNIYVEEALEKDPELLSQGNIWMDLLRSPLISAELSGNQLSFSADYLVMADGLLSQSKDK